MKLGVHLPLADLGGGQPTTAGLAFTILDIAGNASLSRMRQALNSPVCCGDALGSATGRMARGLAAVGFESHGAYQHEHAADLRFCPWQPI